eukprot:scaffold12626_cov62-Phaeocystis_antarctica.AAC.7
MLKPPGSGGGGERLKLLGGQLCGCLFPGSCTHSCLPSSAGPTISPRSPCTHRSPLSKVLLGPV